MILAIDLLNLEIGIGEAAQEQQPGGRRVTRIYEQHKSSTSGKSWRHF